ncbi:MAG: filamentous hemagglutinin N-terminal domain-containing protein [Cyanobacteria bacterium P01_D01_bin.116]
MKSIYWLGLLGITSFPTLFISPSSAQTSNIVPDNSLGAESSQVIENFQNLPPRLSPEKIETIIGGAERGINLFHSFQEFNINEGRGAYFFSPNAEIQNILARVTGGNPSEILGTLGTIGGSEPNLFLINPSGIVFGESASLDVSGSFVGTTANGLQFGEQGVFSATNPQTPALLTVNPSALFFYQITSGSITNNSIAEVGLNQLGLTISGLQVPNGKSLLLLGGNINLNGGGINAFGGHVELGGVKRIGTVALNIEGNNLRLTFPDDLAKADLMLTNGARVDVVSGNNGSVVINSHNLSILRSLLLSGIFPGSGRVSGQAGNITLNATGKVNIVNSFIVNAVNRGGLGNGGNININAGSLSIADGAQINTSTYAFGNSGNININTKDNFIMKGKNNSPIATGITSSVQSGGVGKGGNITIKAKSLSLNRAAIVTSTYNQGDAGKVNIDVRDSLNIEKVSNLTDIGAFPSGIFTTVESGGIGNGGDINIKAHLLSLKEGGQIQTLVRRAVNGLQPGQGDAGNITINTSGEITFEGVDDGLNINEGLTSGVTSAVDFGTLGSAGDIAIKAASLFMNNKAQLNATSQGKGKAGEVFINIGNILQVNNSDISTASTQSSGGAIKIIAKDIRLFDDGDVSTNIINGTAGGGNINLTANTIVALDDSDIFSFARDGQGGDITFNTAGFFSTPLYRPTPPIGDRQILNSLDGDNKVDVNASGAVSGAITGVPDITFIENSLSDLQQNPIDTNALIANSCIARSRKQESTFNITGAGGLPQRPGDAAASNYPTGEVQNLADKIQSLKWKPGEPILEPQGVYELPSGKLILSRECS